MSNARLVAVIVSLTITGWVIYLLAPVLTPFVVAALLAYISNPIVKGLERTRVPRALGVVFVFLLFIAVLLGLVLYLVPRVGNSVAGFLTRLPAYVEWSVGQLPRIEQWLGISVAVDVNALRDTLFAHWKEVGEWTTKALTMAKQSGLTVIGWMVNLILIPVVTFYLLIDWEHIVAKVDRLVPPSYRQRVRRLARDTDTVLGSFLRGQLLVMVALATIYSVGLLVLGLDLALPIGLMAGAVSFVPYLGFITGLLSAGVAAYLQFHDALMLLWVLGIFVAGQLVDGMFLTPRLVGSRIGLHPVAVIFALMAGGQLFGFFGVLIALPAAAAIKVWLQQAHESFVNVPARPRRR